MHAIFNFSFGQSGPIEDAPVDRLESFVNRSLFHEIKQSAHDHRFVLRVHGGVWLVPAAKHANAFELFALQVEILQRIQPAGLANVKRIHLQLLTAQRRIYFDFDGKSVTVPTRHIRRVKAGHGLRLHHKVF